MRKILTLLLLVYSVSALAEYRVYQYIIKNNTNHIDSPKSNLVTSTLDPLSYQAYNGGSRLVSVDLLRTWICAGNTGQRKETCDSPYKKLTKKLAEEILR
jgi:hypothetical protein